MQLPDDDNVGAKVPAIQHPCAVCGVETGEGNELGAAVWGGNRLCYRHYADWEDAEKERAALLRSNHEHRWPCATCAPAFTPEAYEERTRDFIAQARANHQRSPGEKP